MELVNWITGLSLIGIGFLVKAYPNLIAGYNTLSKEQKENVDIKCLSSFLKKGFIIIGWVMIVGYYLLIWLGLLTAAKALMLLAILGGVTILVAKSQQFDHNKAANRPTSAYVIIGAVMLFVVGLLYYGSRPAEIVVSGDNLRITGMYGVELTAGEIEAISLIDTIPSIQLRTNGFSFASSKKGYFQLDSFGKCALFLQVNTGPYLLILKKNGEWIILNFQRKAETKNEYIKLNELINR